MGAGFRYYLRKEASGWQVTAWEPVRIEMPQDQEFKF